MRDAKVVHEERSRYRRRLVWGLGISMLGGWTGVVAEQQQLGVVPAIGIVGALVMTSLIAASIQRGTLVERAMLIGPFATYAGSVFFLSRYYLEARGGRIFAPELALPAVCALPVFGAIFLLVGPFARR